MGPRGAGLVMLLILGQVWGELGANNKIHLQTVRVLILVQLYAYVLYASTSTTQ